jgi:hypothetical protein
MLDRFVVKVCKQRRVEALGKRLLDGQCGREEASRTVGLVIRAVLRE